MLRSLRVARVVLRPGRRYYAGLSILIRPTLLFFLPFWLWGLWVVRPMRSAFMAGTMLFLAAAAIVAPWSFRNYKIYDQFVLVTPVQWTVLLSGNNRIVVTDPQFAGYCVWYSAIPEYSSKFEGLRQIERETVAKGARYRLAPQQSRQVVFSCTQQVRSVLVTCFAAGLAADKADDVRFMGASSGTFIPAFFITLCAA